MVEATIRSINPAERTAVLETRDGREVSVHFPSHAHIEVTEPCSGGTQGKRLEDIGVSYLVQADLHEHSLGAPCHVTDLIGIG